MTRKMIFSRWAAYWAIGLIILAGTGLARAEAVHFKQLLPFVDLKFSGWEVDGKPSGTTMKHGDTSMSQAQATYRSGNKTLEIVVMDFLGKTIPFLMQGQQIEMESSEESLRTTTIQGFKALETFQPPNHH